MVSRIFAVAFAAVCLSAPVLADDPLPDAAGGPAAFRVLDPAAAGPAQVPVLDDGIVGDEQLQHGVIERHPGNNNVRISDQGERECCGRTLFNRSQC